MVFPELNTQKDKWNPITIHGKGNYFLTSIVHLEHFLEQLTYLIDHERIPVQFREAVSAAKHIIIPDVAAKLNAPNGCEYRYGEPLPAQCRADTRMVWYLLNPWMLGKMQGAFNRLTYLPTATVLTPSNPHCLNPTLDWVSIEDAYLRGDTLVIDQLLTPHCFSELRRLALEGTLFYEAKSTYVGAYIDEGMSEFTWMGILREEFQERFPRVLGKEVRHKPHTYVNKEPVVQHSTVSAQIARVIVPSRLLVASLLVWSAPSLHSPARALVLTHFRSTDAA